MTNVTALLRSTVPPLLKTGSGKGSPGQDIGGRELGWPAHRGRRGQRPTSRSPGRRPYRRGRPKITVVVRTVAVHNQRVGSSLSLAGSRHSSYRRAMLRTLSSCRKYGCFRPGWPAIRSTRRLGARSGVSRAAVRKLGFCVTVSARALISRPSFASLDQPGTRPFTGLAPHRSLVR